MEPCQHMNNYFLVGFFLVAGRMALTILLILGAWKALELIYFIVSRIQFKG